MAEIVRNNPLLSIVTCTYNCVSDLEQTIESVFGQSFKNYEHVVIDGGSTDGTKEYLNEMYKDGQFAVFLSEKDHGIYDALNKGISASKGEVIGILHAGTKLQPKALECLAKIITEDGLDRIIAGSVVWRSSEYFSYELRSNLAPLSSRNTKLLHESIFIPRKLYRKVGVYDTRYKISADYEWISRAESISALDVVYTDDVLISYGSGWGLSGSISNERQKIREHYDIAKKYIGFFFSFRRYAFRLAKLSIKRVIKLATRRS